MSNKLSLLVNFQGVDKLSGSLRNIIGLGRQGSQSINALRGESRRLENQLKQVRHELVEGMADGSRKVGDLVARERQLTREVEAANTQLRRQREVLAQIARGRELQALGGRIGGAGRTASLYVTAPALAAGYAAAQLTRDFDASMSNISTLIDTSRESMDDMGESVRQISTRVPVQLEELPPALYNIRSAGIGASEAMNVLEQSGRLGVAGLGTTAESADIATSAMNAFNLQGDQAARVYDTIFKTVRSGKTTITQLSQGFGGVAGTVAAAGVQFDEFQASVAALTTTGLPASQAYTQLRSIISGLTRETAQSRRVFRALGANDLKDLIEKSGGLVPALNRIKSELHGNDAAMLQLIGSTEGLNAMIGLTGNQAQAFRDTLTDMRSGADAMNEAFAKQSSTDVAQNITNMNELKVAAIEAGAAIAPVMTQVLQVIADLATKFGNLSPETQKFVIGAIAITAAIGPLLMIGGSLVTLFGALTVAAGVLGISVGLTAGLIIAIPLALGAAAYLIYTYWDEIRAAFWAAVAMISNPLGAIVMLVSQKWNQIKAGFVAGWEAVKLWFSALPEQMKTIGTAMMDGLLLAINPMALAQRLVSMARNGISTFMDYLDINSPSRVFMRIGGSVTEGLTRGIDRGGPRSIAAISRLATGVTAAGALGIASVSPAAAAGPGTRGADSLRGGSAMTITINVYQQPGQDARELAREIRDQIRGLDAVEARGTYEDGV